MTVWRDPEHALRVVASDLPADLRKIVSSPEQGRSRLLDLLTDRPEDWQVHAVVRAEIFRSGEVAFARKALEIASKNVLKYQPLFPHWRTRRLYSGGLAMYCARIAEKGRFKVGPTEQNSWFREGQDAYDARVHDLRSVEDAYLALSVYRNVPIETSSARTYLRDCIQKFGKDVGLTLYTARLFSIGVSGSVNVPLKKPTAAKRMKILDAPWSPIRVREAALSAWQQAPKDPGVMGTVASCLALLKDPLAHKAVAAYEKTDDPDRFRWIQLHRRFPSYFKKPGTISGDATFVEVPLV